MMLGFHSCTSASGSQIRSDRFGKGGRREEMKLRIAMARRSGRRWEVVVKVMKMRMAGIRSDRRGEMGLTTVASSSSRPGIGARRRWTKRRTRDENKLRSVVREFGAGIKQREGRVATVGGVVGVYGQIEHIRFQSKTYLRCSGDLVGSSSGYDANDIVNKLLVAVKDTDRGAAATQEKRSEVKQLIDRLASSVPLSSSESESTKKDGDTNTDTAVNDDDDRMLNSPLMFGEYDVSYTATGSKQYGEPAGGRFRGALGRAVFQTRSVRQNIYSPNIVENVVEFSILGRINGRVSLLGTFRKFVKNDETENVSNGDANTIADTSNTVRADFEKPKIELSVGKSRSMTIRLGPTSTVVLKTPYVDERVRLGIGGRGSLFVFKRINNNMQKSTDDDVKQMQNGDVMGTVVRIGAGIFAIMAILAFTSLRNNQHGIATFYGTLLMITLLIVLAIILIFRNGGIINGNNNNDKNNNNSIGKRGNDTISR